MYRKSLTTPLYSKITVYVVRTLHIQTHLETWCNCYLGGFEKTNISSSFLHLFQFNNKRLPTETNSHHIYMRTEELFYHLLISFFENIRSHWINQRTHAQKKNCSFCPKKKEEEGEKREQHYFDVMYFALVLTHLMLHTTER